MPTEPVPTVPAEVLRAAYAEARRCYPEEACGFLLGPRDLDALVQVRIFKQPQILESQSLARWLITTAAVMYRPVQLGSEEFAGFLRIGPQSADDALRARLLQKWVALRVSARRRSFQPLNNVLHQGTRMAQNGLNAI